MNISHSVHNIANKIEGSSMDELMFLNDRIIREIKQRRAAASRKAKRGLFKGTKVSFVDNDDNVLTGRVVKTMRKFAKVDTGNAIWRVPMHVLTKV
tara:strand:- start:3935 stop:4222 length:288 start_codon:yes stop_codon:yes gene_type:complete